MSIARLYDRLGGEHFHVLFLVLGRRKTNNGIPKAIYNLIQHFHHI